MVLTIMKWLLIVAAVGDRIFPTVCSRPAPRPPFPADTAGEDFQFILPMTFDAVALGDGPALKAKLNSVCRGC
ncbi:hypothetical protein [Mammaliicoccus sciuri]|uniref:hypothetical protein n=1 Tax=Mammaliicoccus sciuri TaxID=1296 RepID=UPI00128F0ADC